MVYFVRLIARRFMIFGPKCFGLSTKCQLTSEQLVHMKEASQHDWQNTQNTVIPLVLVQIFFLIQYPSLNPLTKLWFPFFGLTLLVGVILGWIWHPLILLQNLMEHGHGQRKHAHCTTPTDDIEDPY